MQENSDVNFSHLLLLYDEVYKCALEIKAHIAKNALSDLAELIQRQGELIQKAVDFEKQMPLTSEQEKEQIEIKSKVALMQKENIEFLREKQEEVRKSINETTKESELKKAYSFSQNPSGSTVDISE